MEKFEIRPSQIERITGWFQSGNGVYRWTSKEIGNPRPDMVTEGPPEKAPHWAYVGEPTEMSPDDFEVVDEMSLERPPEWYPECEHCKGTGVRSVAELAEIRKEPIEVTQAFLRKPESMWKMNEDETGFACNYCRGTGHIVPEVTFRVKRMYWGGWEVSDTGKRKCDEIARKLEKHYGLKSVLWAWEHWGSGIAHGRWFVEARRPLVVEMPAKS